MMSVSKVLWKCSWRKIGEKPLTVAGEYTPKIETVEIDPKRENARKLAKVILREKELQLEVRKFTSEC